MQKNMKNTQKHPKQQKAKQIIKKDNKEYNKEHNISALSQADTKLSVQDTIDAYGCQIMIVAGTEYLPAYAYTIGLYQQFNKPEVICFGLLTDVMQTLLTQVKNCVEEGEEFQIQKEYTNFLKNEGKVTFINVDKIYFPEYLNAAIDFYENQDFTCLQLVWSDARGVFPWDKKFNHQYNYMQPLLDRSTDFFFYEDPKLNIFTTQNVIDKKQEINYICHDQDGDWFFLENENIDGDDIVVCGLKELVDLHPYINKSYSLDYGYESIKQKNQEWQDYKIDDI